MLKWRPRGSSVSGGNGRDSPAGGRPLLPSSNVPISSSFDSHGQPVSHMSDMRFAVLTTIIIVGSYATALSVSSLDRVLAYVGSTGSTSISFILPGLFYYKISDPEDVHHQRLTKEDDDAAGETHSEQDDQQLVSSGMMASVTSLQSGTSGVGGHSLFWRWRKRFRWDLEHLEHGLLRKMALALSIYGLIIMAVCLAMNTFFVAAH